MSVQQPFKATVDQYIGKGWSPLWLPPAQKSPPPPGCTGHFTGPTKTDISNWKKNSDPAGNIGVRCPKGFIGFDLDAYKPGAVEAWEGLQERLREAGLPELPETWISSARQDGVSGIRWYKLPAGYQDKRLPGVLGPGIETIQHTHRYAVAWPSIHPKTETPYLWFRPGQVPSGPVHADVIPDVRADLPTLTKQQVEVAGNWSRLYVKHSVRSANTDEMEEWFAEIHDSEAEPCAMISPSLHKHLAGFDAEAGVDLDSAHENLVKALWYLAKMGHEGHTGVRTAVFMVRDAFTAEVTREGREGSIRAVPEAHEEFKRAIAGAVAEQIAIEKEETTSLCGQCSCDDKSFDPGKAEINTKTTTFHEAVDIIKENIGADKLDGGVYRYGEKIVVVSDRAVLMEQNSHGLTYLASKAVNFYTNVKGSEGTLSRVATQPAISWLTSLGNIASNGFPEMHRIARAPFFSKDGELVTEHGYHAPSKTFLHLPDDLAGLSVPAKVGAKLAAQAKAYIEGNIFEGFPWVDKGKTVNADMATAWAALLLPFVRPMINGSTPLHIFNAPVQGTGKTLCAQVCAFPAVGHQTPTAAPDGQEEMGKTIFSLLLEGPSVILLDNANSTVQGSVLASASTAGTSYKARALGGNSTPEVPVWCTWMITANNFQASADIARRIVPVRMDAKLEHPEVGRKFKHSNLLAWMAENRMKLVKAALIMIQWWVQQGMKEGSAKLGSFDSWAATMSGILEANGIEGLLENREDFAHEALSESDGITEFVDLWKHKAGTGEKNAIKASEMLAWGNIPYFFEEWDPNKDSSRQLGRILTKLLGRMYDGVAIRSTVVGKSKSYWLEPRLKIAKAEVA